MNRYASSGSVPAFEGSTIQSARHAHIKSRLPGFIADLESRVASFEPFHLTGRVRKVVGTIIHAAVPDVQVGEIVELYTRSNGSSLLAECVGFLQEEALLSPIGETQGVSPRTEVRRTGRVQSIAVGPGLKGRVLDGLGNFIDGRADTFDPETWYPVYKDPPDPMKRRVIDKPLPTGLRAIDCRRRAADETPGLADNVTPQRGIKCGIVDLADKFREQLRLIHGHPRRRTPGPAIVDTTIAELPRAAGASARCKAQVRQQPVIATAET